MPVVQVEIIKGRTIDQKRNMVSEVTEAICRTLVCPKEAVKIMIREMEKENYAEGGQIYFDKSKA